MSTKNRLTDLHNHLFEQLERLNDDELVGEELNTEIKRARAICGVASQIVANGNLALDAAKSVGDSMSADYKPPKVLLDE